MYLLMVFDECTWPVTLEERLQVVYQPSRLTARNDLILDKKRPRSFERGLSLKILADGVQPYRLTSAKIDVFMLHTPQV